MYRQHEEWMPISATAPVAQKRILLLSVSAGAGHTRAAEAIRSHADRLDGAVTATHLDVMDFVPAAFRKLYTDFYLRLVNKHPAVWGYLYQLTNEAQPDGTLQKLRRGVERLNTRALHRQIADFQPDAIICTHFLPAEILAHMIRKAKLSCPVWVQVTDFDLHQMWVQQNMTGYFAPSEEVAFRMRAQGILPQAVHVTGIPIMPAFSRIPDRATCAAEYGLDPGRTTILLMGGGAGLGSLDQIATRLLALDADFQLIALAGKNAEALAALQVLAERYPQRLFPQAYSNCVERLMACADLAITKPGGLTSSECLAMGLPMIVNSPIPGQEERNADFLMENGVALKAFDAVTLEYRVQYLLKSPAKLADMRANALRLHRPDAARTVLDIVLHKSAA
jgi:processive 1,2-diacylglycerol beta-glucosyltransferase